MVSQSTTILGGNMVIRAKQLKEIVIDLTGPDGNAPYAYSLGIQSILNKTGSPFNPKHLLHTYHMKLSVRNKL